MEFDIVVEVVRLVKSSTFSIVPIGAWILFVNLSKKSFSSVRSFSSENISSVRVVYTCKWSCDEEAFSLNQLTPNFTTLEASQLY